MKTCSECHKEITDKDVRIGNCYHLDDVGFLHKQCYYVVTKTGG